MIRFFSLVLFFSCFFILSSCKSKYEECTEEDYNNCNTHRPETGLVEIQVTINEENPLVTVQIYEGNFEDGKLLRENTSKIRYRIEYMDAEKTYSFTATYKKGNDTIRAVDGGTIEVSSYQACEYKCYEVKNLYIDLTLN